MTLQVILVTSPKELEIAKDIRFQVFVYEQGFAADIQIDDKDDLPTTRHFLGKDMEQDKYVATARCLLTPQSRQAMIGRVAVLQECRGKNYGVALMHGMEQTIAQEVDTFMLSSQYDKRGFYEKCGYAYLEGGQAFFQDGVKQCMMVKQSQD